MSTPAWSTQRLSEFVAAVSAAATETAAALAAVERTAEALDADVAGIVGDGGIVASVGYAEGTAPVAILQAIVPGVAGSFLEVPGIGRCMASAASLEHPPGATLVVTRREPGGLSREEYALLRGMARVASLTMRMLRLLDEERAARDGLEEIARVQASLRAVALLVAEGRSPDDVFSVVATETRRVLGVDATTLVRVENDGSVTVVGAESTLPLAAAVGDRLVPPNDTTVARVLHTGRPARIDRYEGEPSSMTGQLRAAGYAGAVGAPVVVDGRIWGVMVAASSGAGGLARSGEQHLVEFTDLVATAVANAQARTELRAVAGEQAALRRVATLVAQSAPPQTVFTAVAEEIGRLFAAGAATLNQYEADGTMSIVAQWTATGEAGHPVGTRYRLVPGVGVSSRVRETGEPARIDRYVGEQYAHARERGIRSAVAAPITVARSAWGVITVTSGGDEPLAPGLEVRLAAFTELVAAAIANTHAQAELIASPRTSSRPPMKRGDASSATFTTEHNNASFRSCCSCAPRRQTYRPSVGHSQRNSIESRPGSTAHSATSANSRAASIPGSSPRAGSPRR